MESERRPEESCLLTFGRDIKKVLLKTAGGLIGISLCIGISVAAINYHGARNCVGTASKLLVQHVISGGQLGLEPIYVDNNTQYYLIANSAENAHPLVYGRTYSAVEADLVKPIGNCTVGLDRPPQATIQANVFNQTGDSYTVIISMPSPLLETEAWKKMMTDLMPDQGE